MENTSCSHDGCDKPVHSKGLCQAHYRQERRRARGLKKPGPKPDPTKLNSRYLPDGTRLTDGVDRRPRDGAARTTMTAEACANGHPWTEESDYFWEGSETSPAKQFCRYCQHIAQQTAKDAEPIPTYELWLEWQQHKELFCPNGHLRADFMRINGKGQRICRACQVDNRRFALYGVTPEQHVALLDAQNNACAICETPFKDARDTHHDHDHKTGAFRELLCQSCNLVLGCVDDDISLLAKMIVYLEQHAATNEET